MLAVDSRLPLFVVRHCYATRLAMFTRFTQPAVHSRHGKRSVAALYFEGA